jgi:hypothetical protein
MIGHFLVGDAVPPVRRASTLSVFEFDNELPATGESSPLGRGLDESEGFDVLVENVRGRSKRDRRP